MLNNAVKEQLKREIKVTKMMELVVVSTTVFVVGPYFISNLLIALVSKQFYYEVIQYCWSAACLNSGPSNLLIYVVYNKKLREAVKNTLYPCRQQTQTPVVAIGNANGSNKNQ